MKTLPHRITSRDKGLETLLNNVLAQVKASKISSFPGARIRRTAHGTSISIAESPGQDASSQLFVVFSETPCYLNCQPLASYNPYVITTSGTAGYGAQIAAVKNGSGHITGCTVVNGGTGYTSACKIGFSGGGEATKATAHPVISGGVITSVVIDGGGLYQSSPAVEVIDGIPIAKPLEMQNAIGYGAQDYGLNIGTEPLIVASGVYSANKRIQAVIGSNPQVNYNEVIWPTYSVPPNTFPSGVYGSFGQGQRPTIILATPLPQGTGFGYYSQWIDLNIECREWFKEVVVCSTASDGTPITNLSLLRSPGTYTNAIDFTIP